MSNVKIKTLRDRSTKEKFYPRTHLKAVIDDNGNDIGTHVSTMESKVASAQASATAAQTSATASATKATEAQGILTNLQTSLREATVDESVISVVAVQTDLNSTKSNVASLQSKVGGLDVQVNGTLPPSEAKTKVISATVGSAIMVTNALVVDIPSGTRFSVQILADSSVWTSGTGVNVYANAKSIATCATPETGGNNPNINEKKYYTATSDISKISIYASTSTIKTDGDVTIKVEESVPSPQIGIVDEINDLEYRYELMNTPKGCVKKSVELKNGKPVKVIYYSSTNAVLRTDTVQYNGDIVVETRTMADGKSLTLTTNLVTLNITELWN